MVIGTRPYDFIAAATIGKPITMAGFEPLDLLQSIWMVLRQIAEGRCEVENQYGRVGTAGRQPRRRWPQCRRSSNCASSSNGAGWARSTIPACAFARSTRTYDAERKFAVPNVTVADPRSCQCGEVLKGVIRPHQCKVFGSACTPQTPLGALMVSSEGACAAYYSYGRSKAAPPAECRSRDRAAAMTAASTCRMAAAAGRCTG